MEEPQNHRNDTEHCSRGNDSAFAKLLANAKCGNTDAMIRVAECYRFGDGVVRNLDSAIKWFRKAVDAGRLSETCRLKSCENVKKCFDDAARGDISALFELESRYRNARGVPENQDAADDCLRAAAELGSTRGMVAFGRRCIVRGNYGEAAKWFLKAAERGNADAVAELVLLYSKEGRAASVKECKEEYEKWFRILTARGSASAMVAIGDVYLNGRRDCPKNYEKAVEWFQRAAECGNALSFFSRLKIKLFRKVADEGVTDAIVQLSHCYRDGTGLPFNDKKALRLLRLAAVCGNSKAMLEYGECFETGHGVKKNRKKSIKWFQRAADAGETGVMRKIGDYYKDCYNLEDAMSWWLCAAEAGDDIAVVKVGDAYRYGLQEGKGGDLVKVIVSIDKYKAMCWYRRAAEAESAERYMIQEHSQSADSQDAEQIRERIENGTPEAMYRLAECYRYGDGIIRDCEVAVDWYWAAARCGHVRAMYDGGKMFYDGDDVPRDYESAAVLWEIAAARGDVLAQVRFAHCLRNGFGIEKDPARAERLFDDKVEVGDRRSHRIHLCYTKSALAQRREPKRGRERFRLNTIWRNLRLGSD